MGKYPYLNEAVASVLRAQRETRNVSKRKLSELVQIERAYITSLERGEKSPTLNVLFYFSDAFDLAPSELIQLMEQERKKFSLEKKNK